MFIYIITGIVLLISIVKDRNKTEKALQIAVKRFLKIFPAFISMLVMVSIILYLIPDRLIVELLGNDNLFCSMILASLFGSLTLMPGFIAFPLCGILHDKGLFYMVISAFTTTLMMVGILTYPIEKEYFGRKVTVLRNLLSYLIAIAVSVVTGILYGELF